MTVRIKPKEQPDSKAIEQLATIKASLGRTPNIFTTLAHSPAALKYYLAGADALNQTKVSAALREQIALAIAGTHQCDYCASAHTAIGTMAKISTQELSCNLASKSNDAKTQAALTFATQIVQKRGHVSDQELKAVRAAGFSEEEIIEIIAIVCLNTFTNYFNSVAQTEVDFPKVSTTN